MCVGGGNVWKWQRKETKDKKEEIRHSSVLQYHIPCVHYAIISWNINRTPTSQTICTELHRCFLPDEIQKLSAGRRQAFSDSDRPVGWWCGRAWPRRKESWQQEGEESHKVATQSSRLACLSRVNITPRLHTVMTNRGGTCTEILSGLLPCPARPHTCHSYHLPAFAFWKQAECYKYY